MKVMTRSRAITVALLLLAAPAAGNPASDELRARAATRFYNLDMDEALSLYRQAVSADPDDAAAHRGLASALWATLTFDRGMLTVEHYLGGISRRNLKLPPPPPGVASDFHAAVTRAIALSRSRVKESPRSAGPYYELGSAIGLSASYAATIDGGVMSAFRAAREAFNAHEKVLELDPGRRDAALVVGTYRYIVSALAMPVRWAAYAAGFGGGRELGIRLIESAAEYPGDSQTDARLALVLVFNREKRYDEAVRQLTRLMEQYPRNRLLWLEAGSTALRAGKAAEANRMLTDGLSRLALDRRPRMFSEEALWYYKRGAALALLGRATDAEQDLRKAVSLGGRRWVTGRARIELGKLALKNGDRMRAAHELREGVRLCESDGDATFAADARRLMK
jgi:tetratricopeptide (TPR) repeat protein